jgi:hypothetical protein
MPLQDVENNKPSWDTYVSYGSELHDKVKNYSAMQTQSRLVQNIAALITAAQSIPAPPRPSVAQAALPCQIPATGMSPWPTLASPKKTQIHNIAAQSTPPKNAVPTPNNLTSSSPQTSLESGYLIGFLNHEPERRSLLDDTISTPDSAFAVLEPVRKSSATKLSSVLQPTTAVRSVSAVHSSFAAGEGNLSVSTIQVVHGTEPETLQKTSEVATRKFHNTMNQKAPNPNNKASKSNPKGLKSNPYASRLELPNPHRPQPRRQAASEVPQYQAPINAVDPLPEFLQEINTSFDEMMKGVRGFQGQVVVQAEFGRFILKRIDERYLSLRSRESSEDPETIQNVLQKGPFIFFTNIVTTIPAEIHYLIDMKDAAGTEMWEKKPARWTVSYEFLCRDTQSLTDYGYAPFMVEIDAETFVTQIKKRRPFGSINVHGTKRHWDFRIAAFGLESNEATEEAYGDFATALRLSLYIP